MFSFLSFSHRKLVSTAVAAGLALGVLVFSAPAAGATWTIQTTPNAPEAEHSNLYDISCLSSATNPCVSVGKQTKSGGNSASYAQAWNGTSWSNISAGMPEGATAGELQSVDCISVLGSLLCYAAVQHYYAGVWGPWQIGAIVVAVLLDAGPLKGGRRKR